MSSIRVEAHPADPDLYLIIPTPGRVTTIDLDQAADLHRLLGERLAQREPAAEGAGCGTA